MLTFALSFEAQTFASLFEAQFQQREGVQKMQFNDQWPSSPTPISYNFTLIEICILYHNFITLHCDVNISIKTSHFSPLFDFEMMEGFAAG